MGIVIIFGIIGFLISLVVWEDAITSLLGGIIGGLIGFALWILVGHLY